MLLPRRFEADDLPEMNRWYMARGVPAPSSGDLSSTGFVIPGVVACFLYKTDSNFAMIEGLVSNPDAPAEVRNQALDAILAKLEEEAVLQGFKKVIGLIKDEGTLERTGRLGYRLIGDYHMVVKSLRPGGEA